MARFKSTRQPRGPRDAHGSSVRSEFELRARQGGMPCDRRPLPGLSTAADLGAGRGA